MGYTFERQIWVFWDTPIEEAPPVVRACVASWRHHNPDWDITVLDTEALADFPEFLDRFDLARRDIDVQKVAALLRLYLLRTFGGVWVDATVFCMRPLDDWLPSASREGLLMFKDAGRDRLASNWFIAADPDNEILATLEKTFSGLFEHNRYWLHGTGLGKRLVRWLTPRFGRDPYATSFWLGFTARKILRVYPYFLFHYTLNWVVTSSPELQEAWDRIPVWLAKQPHTLQNLHRHGALDRALARAQGGRTPMYKLDWRTSPDDPFWGPVFEELTAKVRL